MRGVTDEELITAIASREEAALVELSRRYTPHFRAMVGRMTSEVDAVEELVQDALVRVWDRAERFDPVKSSARTWLITVCHRVAVTGLRGRRGPRQPRDPAAGTFSTDQQRFAGFSEPLDVLDPEARRLFELAFFGGNTHEELAALTGSQLHAVTPALHRALIQLHESFAADV